MTNKKILTITLSLTIIHFVLTSLIGHYIAVQIGTQIGKIVADGLIEGSDNNPDNAEANANEIHQDMKTKSEVIYQSWKIVGLLISLPAKPLMNPLLQEVRKKQTDRLLSKDITIEKFRTQGLIVDYAANLLNSLSLGLLVYLAVRIFDQRKRKT